MRTSAKALLALSTMLCAATAWSDTPAPAAAAYISVTPATLAAKGKVSDRFLSYNIEMVEVTGGRFWRPYGTKGTDRYEYRPPLDLSNARLRKLAAAIGPAYVRYSGTWANATWFADSDTPPAKAPDGFDTVLTRKQWRGAVDFARAANAQIVTSFAVSAGTHDAKGLWQPDIAARWLAYTRKIGGHIAATEFGNEPNSLNLLKPPAGYTLADYRRDYGLFTQWLRKASPNTILLAPGTAELGEPIRSLSKRAPGGAMAEAGDLFETGLPKPDAVSFHFYPGASERCGGPMMAHSETAARAPEWLASIDAGIARTATFRDSIAPGAPLWDTESAETVCGGNRIAATFGDTFRFVDTLARSARQGVDVFIHNTLAASDYGMLDEHTYAPRPNYWAAWVWKQLVGSQVLDAGQSNDPKLNLYAHCLKGSRGGVVLIAINLDASAAKTLATGGPAKLMALTENPAGPGWVSLNGRTLELGKGDRLPTLSATTLIDTTVRLAPKSVNFIALPQAGNAVCK